MLRAAQRSVAYDGGAMMSRGEPEPRKPCRVMRAACVMQALKPPCASYASAQHKRLLFTKQTQHDVHARADEEQYARSVVVSGASAAARVRGKRAAAQQCA